MDIQFDSLALGSEISEAGCAALLGFTRSDSSDEFAIGLLRLKYFAEKALKRTHGREITVRVVKHCLRILDDREAAEYNPKRFADGLRIARRSHRRLQAVDVSKLTPAEREEYGKNVTKQSARLSMMRAPVEVDAVPVENIIPKMFARKTK